MPLSSSSYAVFDSGYQVHVMIDLIINLDIFHCNADVAGLMARTSIYAYPWFSPAGQQRGILNNAIKLAYNPTQSSKRSTLCLRVNPIVYSTWYWYPIIWRQNCSWICIRI
jgi:hypothetical protein